MKNDFYKTDFYAKKIDEGEISKYYLKINKHWIEVSKDVYSIYKSSYQKLYRDNIRDSVRIKQIGNIELLPFGTLDNTILNKLYFYDLKIKLYQAIKLLPNIDQQIIKGIYFYNQTERELASFLNMPNTTLHNKKIKILKKLRIFLEQDDF